MALSNTTLLLLAGGAVGGVFLIKKLQKDRVIANACERASDPAACKRRLAGKDLAAIRRFGTEQDTGLGGRRSVEERFQLATARMAIKYRKRQGLIQKLGSWAGEQLTELKKEALAEACLTAGFDEQECRSFVMAAKDVSLEDLQDAWEKWSETGELPPEVVDEACQSEDKLYEQACRKALKFWAKGMKKIKDNPVKYGAAAVFPIAGPQVVGVWDAIPKPW